MKIFPLDKSVTWKQAYRLHEQINPFSYSSVGTFFHENPHTRMTTNRILNYLPKQAVS